MMQEYMEEQVMCKNLYGDIYAKLEDIAGSSHIKKDEPMAEHTTFRTGGNASVFVEAENVTQLKKILNIVAEYNVPYFVLGNGSNVLVRDEGYMGVIIKLADSFCDAMLWGEQEIKSMDRKPNLQVSALDETFLSAYGQEKLVTVAKEASRRGYTGMESLAGIPGTIGGAVAMNAGAYGTEIKDIIESAVVMDTKGNIFTLLRDELDLSYRHSIVQSEGMIVLKAVFRLKKGEQSKIDERLKSYQTARREKQPLEYPSAGSTFKRPEGYFAGKLIQEAGLRGYTVGGAQVSEKHCGFVINKNHATASDILQVINDVRDKVYKQFNVMLEPEVKIL